MACLACFLWASGCARDPRSPEARTITASIHPLGALAREVAGPDWTIRVLLPPGASPHSFEPTPRLILEGADASLILRVGGGLDDWTRRLVQEALGRGASELVAVEWVDSLLPALPELEEEAHEHDAEEAQPGEQAVDPHVWLDPPGMVPFCRELSRRLQALDPARAAEYRARLGIVEDSLRRLDNDLRSILAPVRQEPFVATHNAWGYLCRRYGLRELGVLQRVPTREPGPKTLSSLVTQAEREGARAVFTEIQTPSASAETLAGELGLPVVRLDPQGADNDPARDGYADLLRWNARRIARALGSKGRGESAGKGGTP